MTEKHKLLLAVAAGMVLATILVVPLVRRPAPNLIRIELHDGGT